MIWVLCKTIAKLAGFNNRQHICSTLKSEFDTKSHKVAQAASSRYESGKPVIITDFVLKAKKGAEGRNDQATVWRRKSKKLVRKRKILSDC